MFLNETEESIFFDENIISKFPIGD